jgi:Lipase (class 3)
MTGATFDPNKAILYGRFVAAAYTMYGNAASHNQRPPASADFPSGYQLLAWIQMRDFILDNTDLTFYGFVAQNESNPIEAVVAIRGTSNAVEWWDDVNAAGMAPFKVQNCGNVGLGFERIYNTLEVIECAPTFTEAAPHSLKTGDQSFSAQVASLLRHRTKALPESTSGTTPSVEITGHSLGAALAILYAAENALVHKLRNPVLCTFASPKIGDRQFVNVFNKLGLTSWRIVNKQDIVPHLPPLFLQHVDTLQLFDSDNKVHPSFGCWHALSTYLYLIDPTTQQLDQGCRLPAATSARLTPAEHSA